MPVCDMCGKETEKLFKARVEGTELTVCSQCAKAGTIIKEVNSKEEEYFEPEETDEEKEVIERIVSDYGEKVKNAREKRDMKQEEFAKMLAIKESLLHKIESGHFEPSLKLAKKIQRKLHIRLIEEVEEKQVNVTHEESGPVTLGDMFKDKLKNG